MKMEEMLPRRMRRRHRKTAGRQKYGCRRAGYAEGRVSHVKACHCFTGDIDIYEHME